jgi:hypothetical protein
MGERPVCEPPFGNTAMHGTAMQWGGSASRDDAANLRYAMTLLCDEPGHVPGFWELPPC